MHVRTDVFKGCPWGPHEIQQWEAMQIPADDTTCSLFPKQLSQNSL